MGTPYRIIVDEKTLETGIVSLQDRDTSAVVYTLSRDNPCLPASSNAVCILLWPSSCFSIWPFSPLSTSSIHILILYLRVQLFYVIFLQEDMASLNHLINPTCTASCFSMWSSYRRTWRVAMCCTLYRECCQRPDSICTHSIATHSPDDAATHSTDDTSAYNHTTCTDMYSI